MFRELAPDLGKLKDKNIPVYSIYADLPVAKSRSKMMEYFDNKGPTIVASTTNLYCPFAPFSGIVDLRTMKFVKVETPNSYLTISDVLEECAKLK